MNVRAYGIAMLLFAFGAGHLPVAAAANPTDISIAEPSPAASADASAAPASAAPVYGDLSHLEYTATEDLTATLVDPQPGGSSDREAATFEVATVAGAGIELAVGGVVVDTKKIGKRTVDKKTGETHYFFYGVRLAPGPNDVVITPLGSGTLRGTPVHAIVYGPGLPVRIETKVIGTLKADGRTPVQLQIVGYDRWNHPALPGSTVHIAIIKGDAHFESLRPAPGASPSPNPSPSDSTADDQYGNPSTPSHLGQDTNYRAIGDRNAQFQSLDVLLLSHGVATLAIVPGLQPGDLVIRTTLVDAQNDVRAFIAPAMHKPMVLGLATAGIGSVPGVPGETVNAPGDANSRVARIALFGVGQIAKDAQATLAYDTADSLDPSNSYGSFADNPGAKPYQTYGDASLQRDDALSRDHLYARIDDKRSSLLWGEFVADTGGTSGIGGFSQLVDGVKVEIAGSNAKVTAFQARNDIAYARQIFSPTGLSNIGGLLHPDIVVGSDTITLVAISRRTGAVLSQTILTRNVDYTLDYGSGFLRFLNPPLPYDENFNPQQLLVTYEYGGSGVNAETTGGRFETALGLSQAVRFGLGYVNDATGSGNLALANQDVTGTLPGGSWTVGHISTHGSLPDSVGVAVPQLGAAGAANGDAYRIEATAALGTNKLDAGFETTSQGFNNPFGGLSTPGLLDYHATITHPFGNGGTITAGIDHEQNNLPSASNSQSNATVHARLPFAKRFTATAGIELHAASAFTTSAGTIASAIAATGNQEVSPVATPSEAAAATLQQYTASGAGSAQATLGLEYKLNKIFTLAANRISNLGGSQDASQPAQTSLEVDAAIAQRGRVFLRQLWSDQPTTSFAAATAALTGLDGARSSTALGVERSLGAATDVDTEYVIDHTASGDDAYAEIGVRERLIISQNLRGEASFQRASTFGDVVSATDASNAGDTGTTSAAPSPSGFDIYGLSLAYSTSHLHASGQYQLRTGANAGYTLDVGAAGALSPDLSAFVSSNDSSSGSGFNNVDDKGTIAFRPSKDDRSVTLFSYERQDGNVSELGTHAEILSLEELYRPTTQTEIALRYAYKLDGDAYYPAQTALFGVRVEQRITSRVDVAGEARFLNASDIPNASATAFALETGYRLGNAVRLAAGYNFSGSPDPSLAAAPTRRGVYATVTSVIDNIFGWGKDGHP
jgi:hypothetical protein